MSYCVHCGVELDEAAKKCPLCGTPVVDPMARRIETAPEFFPTRPAEVAPVSRKGMALLLSSMLLSVALCCILLNFFLKHSVPWSLYVVGAALMLWIWIVLPLLARRVPLWLKLTLDVAAVGLYVWLISLALDGGVWFRGLVIPLLAASALASAFLGWVMRSGRSRLSSLTMLLAAGGVYCLLVEICCDLFLVGGISLGWSLVALACCVGLCIPLLVVRRVPSLRAEVRRRFHF